MSALVDSHSHFDVEAFEHDRTDALARARQAGVDRQVLPAVEAATWPGLRDVCRDYPGLYPAYGLHPMYLDAHRPSHLDALGQWIEQERPVAIGECGLDYFVDGLDRKAQLRIFEAQLRIAREFDLPVIVHARRAVEDVIGCIRRVGRLRGVVHSFPGSREQSDVLWQHGFLVGIGGPVTYEGAHRIRRLVASLPIERLLVETDAPDQPDCRHRGQRNEPARLPYVVETVARLRNDEYEAVAEATTRNAEMLFRLPAAATTSCA